MARDEVQRTPAEQEEVAARLVEVLEATAGVRAHSAR